MSNKLINIAREILEIESDLPYRFDYRGVNHPSVDDFDMFTFEQVWGSTALGFGGIGGQAMTTARTYVFVPAYIESNCFIYFAGRFAYSVPFCNTLAEDIKNERVASITESSRYGHK